MRKCTVNRARTSRYSFCNSSVESSRLTNQIASRSMRCINRPHICGVAIFSILSVNAVTVTCQAQGPHKDVVDVKREKAVAQREERLKKRSVRLTPPPINSAKDAEAYITNLGGKVIRNVL